KSSQSIVSVFRFHVTVALNRCNPEVSGLTDCLAQGLLSKMPIMIVVGVREVFRWRRDDEDTAALEWADDVAERVRAFSRLDVFENLDEGNRIELVRKFLLELVAR